MYQKWLNSPRLSDIILRCIEKKHVWLKLLKRNRILKSSYNIYCKALWYLFRIADEEHHENKLNSLRNDQKKKLKNAELWLFCSKYRVNLWWIWNSYPFFQIILLSFQNESITIFLLLIIILLLIITISIHYIFLHLIPQNPHTMFFRYST